MNFEPIPIWHKCLKTDLAESYIPASTSIWAVRQYMSELSEFQTRLFEFQTRLFDDPLEKFQS